MYDPSHGANSANFMRSAPNHQIPFSAKQTQVVFPNGSGQMIHQTPFQNSSTSQTFSSNQSGKCAKDLCWEKYEAANKQRSNHLNMKLHKMIFEERAHMNYLVSNMAAVSHQQSPPMPLPSSRHMYPFQIQTSSALGSHQLPGMIPGTPYSRQMRPMLQQIPPHCPSDVLGTPVNGQVLSPATTPANQSFSSVSINSNGSPCSMNSGTPGAIFQSPSAVSSKSDSSFASHSSGNLNRNNPATMQFVGASQNVSPFASDMSYSTNNSSFQSNGNIGSSANDLDTTQSEAVQNYCHYSSPTAVDTNNAVPSSVIQSNPSYVPSADLQTDWQESIPVAIGQNGRTDQTSLDDDLLEIPSDLDLSRSFEDDLFRPQDALDFI